MHYHLTDIQILLGGFALALMIIFLAAAFLDDRWRRVARNREFEDRVGANYPEMFYADPNMTELGTAEGRITVENKLQGFDADLTL